MKEGYVQKSAVPGAEEMEKINRYTRRAYGPEEVYTFSLVLCDNDIDRDFERFSVSALEKLKELFQGKTCILDHERKSLNQTARIYDTALEKEEGRVTQAGEPYVRLVAGAYLPRTEKTRETVELIESGILKEVSVSCAVKRSVCSICGKESCSHRKGQTYGGKLCCRVLEDPTDAYECSFVAVPAQREAGVRKGWKEPDAADVLERLEKSGGMGVNLSAGEAAQLRERLRDLEQKALVGESYREKLLSDVLKYSAIAQPEVPGDVMKAALAHLELSQLMRLEKAYGAMADRAMPLRPQLAPEKKAAGKEPGNGAYQI